MQPYLDSLIAYALREELIAEDDRFWAQNRLLNFLGEDAYASAQTPLTEDLEEILKGMEDFAAAKGRIPDTTASRDRFDAELMGLLTPRPSEVRRTFAEAYAKSPEAATEFFYKFSQRTGYIRAARVKRDLRWKYDCEFGKLDITINLSKPEKDPRDVAAARLAPQSSYPKCLLCAENEGYAGRVDHPGRGNHRILPVTIGGEDWYWQYSPYTYYNEHCIVLNARHVPMCVDGRVFDKLFDFLDAFPHYFIGSNAGLPIVGGSILSHEHFQGGRYVFAMETAPVETKLSFDGFPDVAAGIVKWPLSVIRLRGKERARVAKLAQRILAAWESYTDESVQIFAETDGEPHNTVTPIARRRDGAYELDFVLRNNLTTEDHPLGVYHPHAKYHHIKKENIGLIEVLGLAVLPSRLKMELARLRELFLAGGDLRADELTVKHADWIDDLRACGELHAETVDEDLRRGVGAVFLQVLACCGVFKRTPEGREAFLRFIRAAGGE
ncbi:MAG: UDP-glucose--hexose-1-phosphate uridylyltransferase [Oscillospiraceae bacterium]|nr:UDP-glucose--hexose-1-phosphate uridylyltransferase [Oscillospiraceae bacterium]